MSEVNTSEITLTLDPFGEEAAKLAAEEDTDEAIVKLDELVVTVLTPEEQKAVTAFSEKINITNTTSMLQYGAATQQKIAEFSDTALEAVRTQNLGEAGDMISKLVTELQDFNGDIEQVNSGFFNKFFKSTKKKITSLQAKYDKVNVNVNSIVGVLENHEVNLTKDIAVLDKLYDNNLLYFKELSMYILAGKQRLELERTTTLAALEARAKESGLPEDAQKAKDFAECCTRFEKKLYDLELSRMVSIQMGPQIRLVQNNDAQMTEKIQSTIVNTIPLWKSQMLITLGLSHTAEALQAEQKVTEMTNELLKKNAALLHQSTVEVAKESERGIIDIETLTAANRELIGTLDEVQQIRNEGSAKRAAAEAELAKIETELKDKLLEMSKA
ncbi:MAG: toxic anion resistance protein [Lachnospiraceae bacterium]|nr:toxic anion resistance protein [Lachnospiraceae bacterium]